jgi:pilus assembly protein CpaE
MKALAKKIASHDGFQLDTRHIQNGHADPLYGLDYTPDVVVMLLNDRGYHDLEVLIEEQSPDRPPLIILAQEGDAQTMRLAMKAGARDFLPGVVTPEELIESIEHVSSQLTSKDAESDHRLTAFVNAKGGSGATFIACNVAHVLESVSGLKTALLSLDMQFESLAQYFDTDLKHGLAEVLEAVESLDAVALDAYMTQHHSGLRMLAAQPEDVIQCHSDRAEQLGILLAKMADYYDHVVVDIPRRVDPYHLPVLERANKIVLVVQQTLGHLRDAARMLQIFGNYGVDKSRILVLANRYDKNATITIEDVRRALPDTEVAMIPSDFKTVAESVNLGIPMHEHARGSSVTKALLSLETQLGGRSSVRPAGFLKKTFSNILGRGQWSQA